MGRRRRSGLLEDVVAAAALMPWWAGVVLAAIAFLVLDQLATHLEGATAPSDVADVGAYAGSELVRTLAGILRYVLPLALGVGALISFVSAIRRRSLVSAATGSNALRIISSMSWRAFEQLISEIYRQRGYAVSETRAGEDGGVDLRLRKGAETMLVQCKHWRARKVGVDVVRELYGVMAAEGATGGAVVTGGDFTRQAREFAHGRNIELVDGSRLSEWLGHSTDRPLTPEHLDTSAVDCPRCHAPMVSRVARRGPNAGDAFFGCSRFPSCRGVRSAGG